MSSVRLCPQCGQPIPKEKPANAVYCSRKCGSIALHLRYGNRIDDGIPRQTRGAINELRICVDLMEQGYSVYKGVGPHCKCDLVAIKGDAILRVEVKTGHYNARGIPAGGIRPEQRSACDTVAYVMADGAILYSPALSAF